MSDVTSKHGIKDTTKSESRGNTSNKMSKEISKPSVDTSLRVKDTYDEISIAKIMNQKSFKDDDDRDLSEDRNDSEDHRFDIDPIPKTPDLGDNSPGNNFEKFLCFINEIY